MATIYDLFEVTGISQNTTYSNDNGNLLGVVDGMVSSDLDDGEFDLGDDVFIGGVQYNLTQILEPASNGTFLLGDGSTRSFSAGSERNLDAIFLTVSNGSDTRYFIVPNDSYGDMNVQAINVAGLKLVAGSDAATISLSDNQINVVCFVRGTMIEVEQGRQVPVQKLRRGDLVWTVDHGLRKIRWVGSRAVNADQVARDPSLRPIRIKAGALGPRMPLQDLLVSQQHRVLANSSISQRMFDEGEVLVAARHLVELDGIDFAHDVVSPEYFHILLDRHEILRANGADCESLFAGSYALHAVADAGRREILALFPQLLDLGEGAQPCRYVVSGAKGRKMVQRHAKNDKSLVDLEVRSKPVASIGRALTQVQQARG